MEPVVWLQEENNQILLKGFTQNYDWLSHKLSSSSLSGNSNQNEMKKKNEQEFLGVYESFNYYQWCFCRKKHVLAWNNIIFGLWTCVHVPFFKAVA